MSPDTFLALVTLGAAAFVFTVGYLMGRLEGGARQRKRWRPHIEKCDRYRHAVDDLDHWCGYSSPHARLIARHLRAAGEGLGMNAGTPHSDEACTISGLRDQLRRLDAAHTHPTSNIVD